MNASLLHAFVGLTLFTGLGGFAWADERDLIARFRDVEPGVTVQRAHEAGAESAEINLPFLPGDRAWTDAFGRAELQFTDGSLLWLDARCKLDFAALESRDQAVLRLWSGALFLRVLSPAVSFMTETSSVSATTRGPTEVRIDIRNGETRVTAYSGEVAIDNGNERRELHAGERAYAGVGDFELDIASFDPYTSDAFDRWVAERDNAIRWSDVHARRLPDELAPYADELDAHGTWRYDADVGNVWYPQVDADWSPYTDGRWIWTTYGWTWVPREPWGWATCHYGRWGFSLGLGWYWIPARTWGPAWVSWTIGRNYVGWCPLGRHNRSVFVFHHHRHGKARFGSRRAWRFARRGDFGSRRHFRRHGNDFRPDQTRFTAFSSVERRPRRNLAGWEKPRSRRERARLSRTSPSGAMSRHPRHSRSTFPAGWSSRNESRDRRVERSGTRSRADRRVLSAPTSGASQRRSRRSISPTERSSRNESRDRRVERSGTRSRAGRRVLSAPTSSASQRRPGRSVDSSRDSVHRRASSAPNRRIQTRRSHFRPSSRAATRSVREREPRSRAVIPRRSGERHVSSNERRSSSSRANASKRRRDPVSRFVRSMTRSEQVRRNANDRSEKRQRVERSSSRGEKRSSSAKRRAPSRGKSKGVRGRSARRRR